MSLILSFKDAGLISGYTGHVPISRDQFGLSYGKIFKYHMFAWKSLFFQQAIFGDMDSPLSYLNNAQLFILGHPLANGQPDKFVRTLLGSPSLTEDRPLLTVPF